MPNIDLVIHIALITDSIQIYIEHIKLYQSPIIQFHFIDSIPKLIGLHIHAYGTLPNNIKPTLLQKLQELAKERMTRGINQLNAQVNF